MENIKLINQPIKYVRHVPKKYVTMEVQTDFQTPFLSLLRCNLMFDLRFHRQNVQINVLVLL